MEKFTETEPRNFPETGRLIMERKFGISLWHYSHLNDANINLQRKRRAGIWPPCCDKQVQCKVKIFQKSTFERVMAHFPTCPLNILQERISVVGIGYVGQIKILIDEFNNRPSLLCDRDLQLKLIEDPVSKDSKRNSSIVWCHWPARLIYAQIKA